MGVISFRVRHLPWQDSSNVDPEVFRHFCVAEQIPVFAPVQSVRSSRSNFFISTFDIQVLLLSGMRQPICTADAVSVHFAVRKEPVDFRVIRSLSDYARCLLP